MTDEELIEALQRPAVRAAVVDAVQGHWREALAADPDVKAFVERVALQKVQDAKRRGQLA